MDVITNPGEARRLEACEAAEPEVLSPARDN